MGAVKTSKEAKDGAESKNSAPDDSQNSDSQLDPKEQEKADKKAKAEAKKKAAEEKKAKAEADKKAKADAKKKKGKRLFVIPNAPRGDSTAAFWMPKFKEGTKQLKKGRVIQEEKRLEMKDGAYVLPSNLSPAEEIEFVKVLNANGFKEVNENDPYFQTGEAAHLLGEELGFEFHLLHPSWEEGKDSGEYKLEYNDCNEPVSVILLVKRGVIKTSNRKWADMLEGLGFVLDKKHAAKD